MGTKNLTPFKDINDVLTLLSESLAKTLGKQLVGLYLTGSLTYGGFDRGSSDIDFVAMLTDSLSSKKLKEVERLHFVINEKFPF